MRTGKRNVLHEITRGGQITFHNIRMLWQVFKKNNRFIFVIYLILAATIFMFSSNSNDRYYTAKYFAAEFMGGLFFSGKDLTTLQLPDGAERKVSWNSIRNNDAIKSHYANTKESIFNALVKGLYFSFFSSILILIYFRYRGRAIVTDDFVRGAQIGSKRELIKRVKETEKKLGRQSPFTIADIPFPPLYDTRNMVLVGSPGVGKSTVYRELIRQFREQGKKSIIYDISGEFTRKFYREGKDFILNPRDMRCAQWSVWSEGKEEDVYSSISNSLIKESNSDPFWHTAPRLVFRAIISNMGKRMASPKMSHLSNILMKMSNEKLAAVCAKTPAKAVFNLEQDKTTASIRSIMTTFTEVLSQISDEGKPLSLFDWAKRDDDSCIFLTCQERDKELMSPIITMWFELAMKGIMSLDVDDKDKRRIYLFIDELPSLQKIPSLRSYLAQARKYGGGSFLGIQSKSQLEEIYGDKGASAITDVIGSYLIFRCDGPEGAEWASKVISSNETDETKDGVSFGANDMRDGVNIGNDKRERRVVMPAQIMGLEDLEFYIKLGRGYPIIESKIKYKKYPNVANAIEPISESRRLETEGEDADSLPSDFLDDTESSGSTFGLAHEGEPSQNKPKKENVFGGVKKDREIKKSDTEEQFFRAEKTKQRDEEQDGDRYMYDADNQGIVTLEDFERMHSEERDYEMQLQNSNEQKSHDFTYL